VADVPVRCISADCLARRGLDSADATRVASSLPTGLWRVHRGPPGCGRDLPAAWKAAASWLCCWLPTAGAPTRYR